MTGQIGISLEMHIIFVVDIFVLVCGTFWVQVEKDPDFILFVLHMDHKA